MCTVENISEYSEFLSPGEDHPLLHPQYEYTSDYRETNKGLHFLYFSWAMEHLRAIDLAIHKFASFSNLNMDGCVAALNQERAKLVWADSAYAEADMILRKLKLTCGNDIVDSQSGNKIG